MARDGSGTYSLPTGNPVVTGQVISSTIHNNTMSDIADEITNSIDKDGQTVWTGAQDANGNEIILDVDGDTSITADTDDQIDVKIAGSDDFQFLANQFKALSGSSVLTDTISETTAANGVSIDSAKLKDGNFVPGNGNGVDFAAAGGSVLDDFVNKGTYTATLTCGTSGTITLNSTNNKLAYTVIGDEVVVSGHIVVDSVSSPVGDLRLNLPFTSANLSGNAGRSCGTVFPESGLSALATAGALAIANGEGLTFASIVEKTTTGFNGDVADHVQAGTMFYIQFSFKRA